MLTITPCRPRPARSWDIWMHCALLWHLC